jgi:ribosome-associated translation inhibitor RaiA
VHVYLTARHIELDDAIREYVERRIVEPVRTHTRLQVTRLEIQLYRETERGAHVGCHVRVEMKGHHQINVREVAGDVPAAIDLTEGRLIPVLTEHRDRMLTLRRHPIKYSFEKLGRALGWGRR